MGTGRSVRPFLKEVLDKFFEKDEGGKGGKEGCEDGGGCDDGCGCEDGCGG